MKPILRPALKFFLLFFLLYTTLIGLSLIPQVGSFCNAIYQAPAEPILKVLLSKAHLELNTDPANPDVISVNYASKQAVQEQMRQASNAGGKKMRVDGRNYQFYFNNLFLTFFLFFLALMVLSPLPTKTKLTRILIGTLIYYAYTVFKMWLVLLTDFSKPEIAIYQFSDFTHQLFRSTLSFMTLGANVLFILILWIILVFDKSNWRAFLQKGGNILGKE